MPRELLPVDILPDPHPWRTSMLPVQVASRFLDASQERPAEGMQLVDKRVHFSSLDCGARAHNPGTQRSARARERLDGGAPNGHSRVYPADAGRFSD
jgi:hypothetical protein